MATGGAAVVCGSPHQFFSKGYDQPCIPSMAIIIGYQIEKNNFFLTNSNLIGS